MRIFLVIVIIILSVDPLQVFSQPYNSSPSNLASFNVDEIKGCAPLTITINAAGCSLGCTGLPDANDLTNQLSIFNSPFPLTYNTPGTYTLLLVNGTLNSSIIITVYPDTPPAFDLYACNGNKVSLKVTDTNYDSYIVDYPASAPKSLLSGVQDIHNMPVSALPQTVKVRGIRISASDNCSSNTKSVVVSPVINPPKINLLDVSSSTTIDLQYSEQPSVLYKSEIGINSNTSFQNLPDVHDTGGNFSVSSNITPTSKYYCFRMRAFDYCTSTPGVYSPIICSADFDAVAANDQVNFSWATSNANISNYSILRDGALLSNPLATATIGSDPSVVCNTTYDYQLISNYTNGAKSQSIINAVTTFSNDPVASVTNISTILNPNGNGVDLTWPAGVNPKEYTIFKTIGSSNNSIGTSITESFSDNSYSLGSNACYKITLENLCNNVSPFSNEVCPIELSGKLNKKDNSADLSWTSYLNATEYQIEKYDEQGNLLEPAFSVGNATTYHDPNLTTQTTVYKIIAIVVGSDQSISNEVTLIKSPKISYPTAFTPNSTASVNRTFVGIGNDTEFISEFEMKIFNRWGEMVFSTNNIDEGWDGTFKGLPMPEGIYAWMADLTDELGRKFKWSGSVFLLKKK